MLDCSIDFSFDVVDEEQGYDIAMAISNFLVEKYGKEVFLYPRFED